MKERTNIWGKPDCELPSGELCNACCVLPNIELEGSYVSVGKPANSPCPYLISPNPSDGMGCSLHPLAKPETCKAFHCGGVDTSFKLRLIAQALSSNLVSQNDALLSATNVLQSRVEEKVLAGIIAYSVLEKAKVFAKLTRPRDLDIKDLDET